MVRGLLQQFLRYMALRKGRFKSLYLKVCQPGNEEYAIFMKAHGKLHALGEHCRINVHANITDLLMFQLAIMSPCLTAI